MDPVSGRCVWTNELLRIPVKKIQQYIDAAQEGTFIPDRENDKLTKALGILSTLDKHEARQAPLCGRLGFPTQAVIKPKR